MGNTAGGYLLRVEPHRRETLLGALANPRCVSHSTDSVVTEAVPIFQHSSNTPLLVFVCLDGDTISHVATGKRGNYAGEQQVCLDLINTELLNCPVRSAELDQTIDGRLRSHFRRVTTTGGILPPATFQNVTALIAAKNPGIEDRFLPDSDTRYDGLKQLNEYGRANLAMQRDSMGVAMQIAGFDRALISTWTAVDEPNGTFLEGLKSATVTEQDMINADLTNLPGFKLLKGANSFDMTTLVRGKKKQRLMHIIMANQTRLETQMGVDLIYYNKRYRSFVMVQYKAMNNETNDIARFRWRKEDQFHIEIDRMKSVLKLLQDIPSKPEADNFRFLENPFFIKFCPRVVMNPDDTGLFKGIYLPLELWDLLDAEEQFTGPRGGHALTFDNVGRKFDNTEFANTVANAWVGTSSEQSHVLEKAIEIILSSRRSLTLAIDNA